MEAEESLTSLTLMIRKQNVCQVYCYQHGSLFLSPLLSPNKMLCLVIKIKEVNYQVAEP